MSEQRNAPTETIAPPTSAEPAPEFQFLITTRDLILNGESAYGDPASHRAVKALAEVEAHISFARRLGRLPPEQHWDADRVGEMTLAGEFPLGPPTHDLPQHLGADVQTRLDRLAALPEDALDRAAEATAKDIEIKATAGSVHYGMYDITLGRTPSGASQMAAMLRDAEPVLAPLVPPNALPAYRKALMGDRKALELLAAQGRTAATYQARRTEYGLPATPGAARPTAKTTIGVRHMLGRRV